jgi:hypothetical protein
VGYDAGMTVVEELRKEWAVITAAPWAFLTVAVLIGLAIWRIVTMVRAHEVTALREQLRLKDALIRDLRPSASEYQLRTTQALKSDMLGLVAELRIFHSAEQRTEEELDAGDQKTSAIFGSNDTALATWSAQGKAFRENRRREAQSAYAQQFKMRARILRDEALARMYFFNERKRPGGLPVYLRPDYGQYETPTIPDGLVIVADNLEALARYLSIPN